MECLSPRREAVAYLRVSGLGQVQGDGFDRQLSAITAYAQEKAIAIVRVYREEGVSGKSDIQDRPALREMIADVLTGDVRLVLVEKLDRLARFLMYQESILQDLQRRGIELVSVAEPDLCSSDPTRTLMRQVLGAFFQYEREMIVSKLRHARQNVRQKTGRCEGRKAYGATEQERSVLALIRTLESENLTPTKIAEHLNNAGILSRSGGKWYGAVVSRIVNRKQRADEITSVLQEQDVCH